MAKVINRTKNKILNWLLDFLYPLACLGCGLPGSLLCAECFSRRQINLLDCCAVCRQPSALAKTHAPCLKKTNLDGLIVSSTPADKLVHELIYKYKYSFVRALGPTLALLLVKKLEQLGRQAPQAGEFDAWLKHSLLVPVPLHKKRLRWRGFNQAEILAQAVAQFCNLELLPDILIRKKHSRPQQKLKRPQRLKNLINAFALKAELKNKIKNESIILVDDVTTTQASLNECAKLLKKNGAKEVWGLVLTRG